MDARVVVPQQDRGNFSLILIPFCSIDFYMVSRSLQKISLFLGFLGIFEVFQLGLFPIMLFIFSQIILFSNFGYRSVFIVFIGFGRARLPYLINLYSLLRSFIWVYFRLCYVYSQVNFALKFCVLICFYCFHPGLGGFVQHI